MLRTLVIMRHGEVPDNQDYLTPEGLSQAFQAVGQLLGSVEPKTILYSPLNRTFQTAQGLKDAFMKEGLRDIVLLPAEWLRDRTAQEMIKEFEKLSDGTVVVTHHREIMALASLWGMQREPNFGEAWVLEVDNWSAAGSIGTSQIKIIPIH